MLKLRLSRNLYDKVAHGSFDDVTFDLLQISEREGWQKELVREAYRYSADQDPMKTGNPQLREVYTAIGF